MQTKPDKKGQRSSCFIRVFAFIIIGISIFYVLGQIVMPKRFPYDKSTDAAKLRYYVNEERDSIDALILGTSHPSKGILPMEMYRLYGIKSYNLATSTQPIQASYYALKEAVRYQHPKVVIWDVSNLYIEDVSRWHWKLVADEMALGVNKIDYLKEYLEKNESVGSTGTSAETESAKNAEETIYTNLFPLLEYHTRWKELSKQDFFVWDQKDRDFTKGGQITSVVGGAISVDEMNSLTNGLLQNNEKIVYEHYSEGADRTQERDVSYSTEIPDENVEWFFKIKDLCDANNIQLLAVKVPAVEEPQRYSSAWTEAKHHKTKTFCEENGVAFYDLLYDTDIGLDWTKDTNDSGRHLNLYGAQKVSADLGSYLKEHFELSGEYTEQWDRDLRSYEKVREVALLELEQDFVTYIDLLTDVFGESTIFITVSDEMTVGLSAADIDALRNLGLQTDYTKAVQYSYIVVIENGEVKYEASSNRPLEYSGVCSRSGKEYELYSSGWWTVSKASIQIDGTEYAVNTRGMNIVVYDDSRDLVLDSVAFDTWEEVHTPTRNNGRINGFAEAFEQYIMEVEDQ